MERESPWLLYSGNRKWIFLAVLFLVSASNYLDRHILAVLLEPIRQEFHVSDTLLGLLGGFAFTLFNAVFAIPVARWADLGNRRTIISLAVAAWSVMTMLCGLAQSFWQLVLARVGVGAGEAGAIPPAQSLIVDYFPPDRRATALAIFNTAAVAGSLLGFGVGGYIAALYGWRTAFVLAGLPGLVLAIVVRFILREPRTHLRFADPASTHESVREALEQLWSKRSFRYALLGSVSGFLVSYGGFVFIPSFLMRVMQASLAQVSITFGAVVALASLTGTVCGGWLADTLGRRDKRWLAWLPSVTAILSAPLFMLAFASATFWTFMGLVFFAYVLLTGGSSFYAAIHAVAGRRRRAMAIALVLTSGTLFGGGFGPLITGGISDVLGAHYGADGLRYSLISTMPLLLLSGYFFYRFGRAMPRDLED